jgi:hypothetical protein
VIYKIVLQAHFALTTTQENSRITAAMDANTNTTTAPAGTTNTTVPTSKQTTNPIKAAAAAIHGAGEVVRGTFNSAIEGAFNEVSTRYPPYHPPVSTPPLSPITPISILTPSFLHPKTGQGP